MFVDCPECGSEDIDLAGESELTYECQECGETFDADADEPEADNDRPRCQLSGTDGNVFAIIGAVNRALAGAGQADKAAEWRVKAFQCQSYEGVIGLASVYVDVR